MTKEFQTVVDSILVVSVLTCVLFHCICVLKAMQMNMQCSLIQEFMLYEFKLSQNITEATKTC